MPVSKARGLFLVGVNAAKLLAIRVGHSHEKMMMLATAIFAESILLFVCNLFTACFRHSKPSVLKKRWGM